MDMATDTTITTITITPRMATDMWLLASLAAAALLWIAISPLTCRCPRPRK